MRLKLSWTEAWNRGWSLDLSLGVACWMIEPCFDLHLGLRGPDREGSIGSKLSQSYDPSGWLEETVRRLMKMDYGNCRKGQGVKIEMDLVKSPRNHHVGESSSLCFCRDSWLLDRLSDVVKEQSEAPRRWRWISSAVSRHQTHGGGRDGEDSLSLK